MNFDTAVYIVLVITMIVLFYLDWRNTKEMIRMMNELEPLLNKLIEEKSNE